MAKCKVCKTTIPDGKEYCNNCQDKGNIISNESYLDSLLNSVKNTVPTAESVYKKKNVVDSIQPVPIITKKSQLEEYDDYDDYKVDLGDIEDFDQLYGNEDIDNIMSDIVIGDEELFGKALSDIFSDESNLSKQENKVSILSEVNSKPEEARVPETILVPEMVHEPETMYEYEPDIASTTTVLSETGEPDQFFEEQFEEEITDNNQPQNAVYEQEIVTTDQENNNFNAGQVTEFEDEDSLDFDLNELLNNLDAGPTTEETVNEENNKIQSTKGPDMDEYEEFEQIEAEEDDFLSLLNQISSDDPVAADVKAINDLLNGAPVEPQKKSNRPSDVGEVFSDALKVVSSLNDPDFDEASLLDKIPDKKSKKGKKAKKPKKEKSVKGESEKPKKGLLQRLFGNVDDENAKINGQTSSKVKGEESAATKEVTKKGKNKKAKKVKKGVANQDSEIDELDNNKSGKGKAAVKKDNKKDKKEKQKKTKEIIQVIDEIEEDEGRINRLGAVIVFVFFGLLVTLLLVGTNVVSYTLSIQHATNYFENKKYTQAYNEVYGMEIKDEDIEIYDKIMTVMFVNKQLNSYNNYYSMGRYPDALDSLLKGLRRYDKYIELATMLGIKTDLDYVRLQILAELENVFNLTEEDAIRIINYENMEEYSLEVYDVVLEKMNN